MLVLCAGCAPHYRGPVFNHQPSQYGPPTPPVAPAQPKKRVEVDRDKVAKLEGDLKAAKTTLRNDELEPLRSALVWFELVGAALMIIGAAAAAASFIWPVLQIARRVWLSAILGGAAIIGMSLATAFVLNYLGWVIGLTVAIVVGVIVIYAHDAHGRWRARIAKAEAEAKNIIN